MDKVIDVFI